MKRESIANVIGDLVEREKYGTHHVTTIGKNLVVTTYHGPNDGAPWWVRYAREPKDAYDPRPIAIDLYGDGRWSFAIHSKGKYHKFDLQMNYPMTKKWPGGF